MKKSTVNFAIDVALSILMASVVGIGFLMKYVLIPGQDRRAVYGGNVDLSVLGLGRHEWGYIHFVMGYALLALVIIHVILHWDVMLAMYRRLIHPRGVRIALAMLLLLLCTALVVIPFFINPVVKDSAFGEGHHQGQSFQP